MWTIILGILLIFFLNFLSYSWRHRGQDNTTYIIVGIITLGILIGFILSF